MDSTDEAVPMASGRTGAHLRGRQTECETLDRLVATVQAGHSAVLVLRGEVGIGKTALLDHVSAGADGCRTARAVGIESEMELAFGGLHQLCAPFLDRLGSLPPPQRDALGTAFGLTAGSPPDRFLVGLAVLSLLADAADKEPLICVVDDAQWLDRVSAQTLAFVARRLLAERIGLVLAVREPSLDSEFTGLPELTVGRLSDSDARALLYSVIPGRLDERVRNRIVAETQGNPLALLELPRGLSPAELAGGFGRPDARPLAGQIEQSFLRRVEALPPATRQLLLVAAAEPVGDVTLLTRAATLLDIEESAASVAEAAGLITIATRVRFRHPVVRSAAYRIATPEARHQVHRALAAATDPDEDPDRRAWHLANATAGSDETVAAELARSAGRAQARGGIAAAAAFLERAAELTPDPAVRGARALAAARAMYQAGGYDAARELLDAATLGPMSELQLAQAELLRGQIVFASKSAGSALPLLVRAAGRLEALDPGLARQTYRDALDAALIIDRLPSGVQLHDIARAALAAPPGPPPDRGDLLLRGLALMTVDGYPAGAPMVLRALDALCTEEVTREEGLGWFPLAARMAFNVWDFGSNTTLSTRLVELARETGALAVLPSALLQLVSNRVLAGELDHANALIAEAQAIGEATGSRYLAHYVSLVTEPWKGREAEMLRAVDAMTRDADLHQGGPGNVLSSSEWAKSVLYNGLGRYEEAYAAAERGAENLAELGLAIRSMVELVEAAARSGRPARAAEAARLLSDMARASGTDWALGTSAVVRAQVHEGAAAETLYQEAVERLGRTDVRITHARAHLLYGEWLRRENRRVDAREHLGIAYEALSRIGVDGFAQRAWHELRATGVTAAKRTADARVALTAQEAQIAHLAGGGMTNPEIGAQLFISPHTVEWHLRKVYAKLGVASRKQLSGAFPDGAAVLT
ncbi:LuxR family transcriptional regulator [Streptomyces longispororuber]|uniref:LuxR family transcriptional regulator n=1 Tax=Streptomyces longispororuber TaxID=68230 RepID=UPI00210D7BD0|nr:LuxR family transcriptional regulator [Streptomyces longispororuber]MCQ4207702.1 AAA family ATPase [Streptomyces longispororuber]